jgi:hypothetical protein
MRKKLEEGRRRINKPEEDKIEEAVQKAMSLFFYVASTSNVSSLKLCAYGHKGQCITS